MNFSPTSRTLFLVQLGTFFSGLIVVICCCLYISAYPKSPDAQSLSGVAIGTLVFSLISTIVTAFLALRQKSGRTVNNKIEGVWVGVAIVLWILASVGGIAKPANNMTKVSCKVLPNGDETSDKNFMRACQSMFASTAFCIITALFFMATAVLLITFSIQRSVREKKAAKVKVGGSYALGPSPSEYRRAEQNGEVPTATDEPKDVEVTSPSTDPATPAPVPTPATSTNEHNFSNNVYQDPMYPMTTPAVSHATPGAGVATLGAGVATPAPVHVSAAADPHNNGYNTYTTNGQHVPQASYQSASNLYDYNNTVTSHPQQGSHNGYVGQGTGHFQQSSAMSNMSASAYDQYNPYASAGNLYANQPQQAYQQQQQQQQQQPYQQQQQPMYPQHTMGPVSQGSYAMMGPPNQQSPYGTQYMNQQQPQYQQQQQQQQQQQHQAPYPHVMAMPQPEHF